jgi:hypothetical protein
MRKQLQLNQLFQATPYKAELFYAASNVHVLAQQHADSVMLLTTRRSPSTPFKSTGDAHSWQRANQSMLCQCYANEQRVAL